MKYLAILALIGSGWAAEDPGMEAWVAHKDELYKAVRKYLDTFSSEKEYKAWTAKIVEREESRDLPAIALDWFFDNRARLEERLPSAIRDACFFFRRFVETGTPPPIKVRESITAEGLAELTSYLKSCVEYVKAK
jgi:hypothetical protein